MRFSFVAVPVALWALAAGASAQSPEGVIDHAVAAWSRVRTARADFDQTLTNPITGSSAQAHGTFQQQRPNHLSIVFQNEGGDRIVADGKYVWIYLPSSTPGQVIRRPATDAGGSVPIDPSSQFLDEPRSRFAITLSGKGEVDGGSATILQLVPKPDARAPFVRARVWVSDRDGLIRQFETVEESGVTRNVRLVSLAINGPVDKTAFRFTVPSGTRVVDR